jgi:hypothetical protein
MVLHHSLLRGPQTYFLSEPERTKPYRLLETHCGKMLVRRPDFRGCGKNPKLSFRGRGSPEECAFLLAFVKKQIPRCVRDGKVGDFFRGLFSRCYQRPSSRPQSELPTWVDSRSTF